MADENILYVPEQSVDAYKAADVWKDFANILPIETTAMQNTISTQDNTPIAYYTISGAKVNSPVAKGVTIIKLSNGKTMKKITPLFLVSP